MWSNTPGGPVRWTRRQAVGRWAAERWDLALQWACGGLVLLALAIASSTARPAEPNFGTLHDLRPPAAADPAAVALAMRAHGCVDRGRWVAGHGSGLPGHLLMTRSGRTAWVTVPDGWALARAGWTTTGWCAR